MDNNRMSNADMLQYCKEALAWEDFGPIDIYFFESVQKILLGECSALEEPDEYEDLMGIERPVSDVELEPEYGNYADIYYGEEGDDDIPDYSLTAEDEAFSADIFGNGFFDESEQVSEGNTAETLHERAAAARHTDKKKNAPKQPKKNAKNTAKSSGSSNKRKKEKTGGFSVNV